MKKLFGFVFSILLCLSVYAQSKNGFEQKSRKDTMISLEGLNAKRVSGISAASLSSQKRKGYGNGMGELERIKSGSNKAAILKDDIKVKIHTSKRSGKPDLIEVERKASSQRLPAAVDTANLVSAFIQELLPHINITDYAAFKPEHTQKTQKGFLVRLTETYKGVSVHGADVILHFDAAGRGLSFNGNYSEGNYELDTTSVLTKEDALNAATQDLATLTTIQELSVQQKKMFAYTGPKINKVIYETGGLVNQTLLAYEVTVMANVLENWKYYIDANSGLILKKYSITCSAGPSIATATDLHGIARSVDTYLDTDNLYYMVDASKPMYNPVTGTGMIATLDAKNTSAATVHDVTSANNSWNHPAAVSAHYNAGIAYDYFYTEHLRNSIDGNGGTIYSIVNVTEENGAGLDNAYWNGQAMFYGNGNLDFHPLARSLDVAGHEMTHGVVQASANLEYYGEPGAINESMADIFGHLMDSTDWLIGEDVVKTSSFPSGALRNLQDPHNGGTSIYHAGYQPKHVSEQYMGLEDNAGVHINSGIPNHAYYLLATSIGKRKAGKIFYKALTEYLTRSSKFIDLRIAVSQSAKDLHGENSAEVTAVAAAFDGVGIYDGSSTVVTHNLPVNPGQDYLLSVDTNIPDVTTVYRSSTSGSGFVGLSTTEVLSRPSITDDGTEAVFVGGDNRLYLLELTNTSSPIEYVLQEEPIWANVAISKDGQRIAAVTIDEDTSIYVYDFALQSWNRFMLYNPTYTGAQSGGPVYADALEWDYSGEYILYDAFNRIQNVSGTDIEYWDVNFIRVWDTSLNQPADGTIEKLFSSLPEGVSIGNAAFSKNSPHILAFDYIDATYSEVAVVAINMETNDLNALSGNVILGYPSYSKLDDQVAFATLDVNNVPVVAVVPVAADKISPSGNPYLLISEASFPVFYTMGVRDLVVLGNDIQIDQKIPFMLYPNPAASFFELKADLKVDHLYILDSKGTLVSSYPNPSQKIEVDGLEQGLYMVKVVSGDQVYYSKLIKE